MSEEPTPTVKWSLLRLLGGVITRPATTFAHLREHQLRTWWLPAALVVLCTVLPLVAGLSAANQQTPGPADIMPIEKSGAVIIDSEMAGRPPMETPTPTSALSALPVAGAVVGTTLTWLIWGGALYLASVFLGRSSGFKPMFRLTVWAWLPYAVRGLTQALYIWSTGNAITNTGFSGFVIDSNSTQIIPPGPGTLALAGILGRVDIFLVWNLMLLVIGLTAFTNLPRRKSITAVLTVWAVLALLSVIPAIIGGMFGSMAM